jgi:hypothetical protein
MLKSKIFTNLFESKNKKKKAVLLTAVPHTFQLFLRNKFSHLQKSGEAGAHCFNLETLLTLPTDYLYG